MSVAIGWAQAPTGTIAGAVTDPTGAAIPKATVTVTSKDTGRVRIMETGLEGLFSAPALSAGAYEVKVEASGFRTTTRLATVTTGATTTADFPLAVGATGEVVTVEAVSSQILYDSHKIDGVVQRQQIQGLPLNGRSFLQLAVIQPGVTISPGTTSQYNSLFSVSILGGDSNKTAITVDGGNIRNSIEGQTQINMSQEVIQEFQLSSVNFDLSTGITSTGAVNVVTRSGSNEYHGSGYYFFRDHNMAAYPHLRRDALAPDPFFARRNPGFSLSGPIRKERLFFFFNYEYMNQVQVFSYSPDLPSLAQLTSVNYSPYRGKTLSVKFDYRLTARHNLFGRYSHDGNRGNGPNAGSPLPSNWVRNVNFSDQSVFGLTSALKPTLVNDFRFNYTYWQNRNLFPRPEDCPGCIGLGFPSLSMTGSSNFQVGNTLNATQGRDLRRFTFVDSLTWQRGSHRWRFGTEIEHAPGTGFWGYCQPACLGVLSPEYVRGLLGPLTAAIFPNMPSVIRTDQDLLNLPIGAGGVAGVGDPSQPPPYNVGKAKVNNRYRLYVQDTWRMKPSFTLNYGLAWNYESTLVNRDLDKPAYLRPLYGDNLEPTQNNPNNFSPSLGFAWNVGKDNKTVVRAGAGIYWETELLWRRLQERAFIGPLGNGRIQYPFGGFTNIFPGIIDVGAQRPVAVGSPLPTGVLLNMTLRQFLQILDQQLPVVNAQFGGRNLNDLSVRTIDVNKSAAQLYPHDYPVQRSYHMSIGLQRELRRDLVISADWARRVFVNTLLGELDYNRWNRRVSGVQTPIIRPCASAAERVPGVQCSAGSVSFWTPGGRNTYNALLVKAEKRFSSRYQFSASYALTAQNGINGIQNLDDWFFTYGPQGGRHVLNASALVELPRGFQVGFITSFGSRGPVHPSITGIDLDGDGSVGTPLPGLSYNSLNRGAGKEELAAAVANWNSTNAGRRDAVGRTIPALTLPASYELGDLGTSQDVRLTKTFSWRERYKVAVFAEMFNLFNVANVGGFNFNLNSGGAFGAPTQRATQVFGSGGPRALQLGARVSF